MMHVISYGPTSFASCELMLAVVYSSGGAPVRSLR